MVSPLQYIYIYIQGHWLNELSLSMVRETGVQSEVESYQRLKNMLLDTALLNTQHYKVRIKGKVELSRELSNTLLYTSV